MQRCKMACLSIHRLQWPLGFTYQCLPSKCTRRKQIKGPHHPKVAGPLNRRLGAVQSAAGLRFSQLAHLDACRYEAQPTATLR